MTLKKIEEGGVYFAYPPPHSVRVKEDTRFVDFLTMYMSRRNIFIDFFILLI